MALLLRELLFFIWGIRVVGGLGSLGEGLVIMMMEG